MFSHFDSYANPVIGASLTVSGGYGANVTGSTDVNGYYAFSMNPINIGGPFALSFAVISGYGNYNTIQGSLTVTAPLVVPVDKVLAGTTISGQTGTMMNRTGSGTVITPRPVDQVIPQGFYDGVMDSGMVSGDTNLIGSNIVSGKSIYGVVGTATTGLGNFDKYSQFTIPTDCTYMGTNDEGIWVWDTTNKLLKVYSLSTNSLIRQLTPPSSAGKTYNNQRVAINNNYIVWSYYAPSYYDSYMLTDTQGNLLSVFSTGGYEYQPKSISLGKDRVWILDYNDGSSVKRISSFDFLGTKKVSVNSPTGYFGSASLLAVNGGALATDWDQNCYYISNNGTIGSMRFNISSIISMSN